MQQAIKKLNNTAPGNCRVRAAMLKHGGDPVAHLLHRVIQATWTTGKAPKAWKRALLTYLYKGKGPRLSSNNYRGISLLSVCSKVYVNIIIARLRPTLDPSLHEAQCGFRPGRSTIDQILTMRRLTELSRAYKRPLYAAFIDYQKAFDCINRSALWAVLASRHVDPHLLTLLRDLYDGCEGEVAVQGAKSAPFPMRTGVRQGCALSPMLFNVYIDHIARTALDTPEMQAHGFPFTYAIDGQLHPPLPPSAHVSMITVGRITFLLYADDIVILSDSAAGLEALLHNLESVSTDWAMTVNYEKTKAMVFHPLPSRIPRLPRSPTTMPPPLPRSPTAAAPPLPQPPPHAFPQPPNASPQPPNATPNTDASRPLPCLPAHIQLTHGHVKFVHTFCYLGCTFTADGSLDADLKIRMGKTRGALQQLAAAWRHRHVPLHIKMLVYRALGPPTLLYGAETWPVTPQQLHQLEVVQNDCMRMIMGVRRADRVSVADLRLHCEDQRSIEVQLAGYHMRSIGHYARRPDYRVCKQVLFAKCVPGACGAPLQPRQCLNATYRRCMDQHGVHANFLAHAQERATWHAITTRGAIQ